MKRHIMLRCRGW